MKADALRGHLDALILATLEGGGLHGYAISEALAARSDGALDLATGTLYPALRRLEAAGLLVGAWSTVSGRKRRTYSLTPAGHRALRAERAAWRGLANVVEAVLRPG
ncbi:PadR family transcriptional regulator [Streptomyces olindensis]|uniref:PadR family transcriptional regulator n=1 Tax=Streptomyces olindensis TaxID=358823 RepID=UPI00364B96A4